MLHLMFSIISEIYLWVLKDNKRAVAFYQKWVLVLMAKKKYLNLENLLGIADGVFFK